jgi:hypothetical protein
MIQNYAYLKSPRLITEIQANPSKKNQVLEYFLQYVYSRKLQKYYFTVIVSQNIAFVLLIKKNLKSALKKSQLRTKRLLRCTVSQSTT